ncbi:MAG: hypothetical protein U0Q16_39270 [Bryobacteraceae bacterium]
MKRTLVLASLLAVFAGAQDTLTNDTIIKLWKAEMSEDFIANAIKTNNGSFTMSSSDLMKLKDAGVSDKIIEMMFVRKLQAQGVKVEVPNQPQAAAAKPAGGGGGGGGGGGAAKPPAPPANTDPGVMYRKDAVWSEVIPESINWSEKGMVKSIKHAASLTLMKKPVEGKVFGTTSRTIVTPVSDIVVTVPGGGSIHDFLLLALDVQKGQRKVEVGPASTDQKGAANRSIAFGVDKIQNNQYKIVVPSGLRPGEYGVVNVKTIGKDADSKIYTFRVIPAA